MRGRSRLIFTALLGLMMALLAAGCGAATPSLAPTESAPALSPSPTSPSSAPAGGSWAVAFTHTFEPDFWAPGGHRYGFRAECPAIDYELSSDWQVFTVSAEGALPEAYPVYLRLRGLSTERFAPSYAPDATIHPGQETTAILWIVGLSEDGARQAASSCEVLLGWDQGGIQPLTAEEPVEP